MKLIFFAILTLLCASSPPALTMDLQAKEEIDFLIREVETSGARFVRNGKEYTAIEGAAHLRQKFAGGGDRIKTPEDFIAGAASRSMVTGKPYMIKSPGGVEMPVGPWLTEKLSKHRRSAKE